ncbi:MAG: hypothetical protein ABWZ91_00575 [Nocardioides sp.]
MEILLWLVPPVVVTFVAMAWVGWVGREGRGEVDREEAVRRLGAALERDAQQPARRQVRLPRRRERSTGVALRRTLPEQPAEQSTGRPADQIPDEQRRAS